MEDRIKELEDRLARAESALERSERLAVASRYASAIMHEVNNPLEAITNLVYLTKLQKEQPDLVFENMNVIEDQLKTLGRVTSQALTFHREQQTAKEIDLVEIAESALKLHSDKLLRHGVVVSRRYRGPARATVFGSEILQVVSNLILNAVDVLEDGKGHICVSVKRCPDCIHITVTDNGPGIPEGFASRLFEPYVTSKASGTGLGLWLSSRIIAKHGGTLRFRTSRTGGRTGTTFRINLPQSG
ncbi:signal transduction histidine kinase [Granulicella aggregans]|uniref:histidine kinase n=1 Tax=Granulicella aggregans TaxID=474949 RepID=A0A7W7ZIF2_9BACT|nr:HAMP domain-containing sensor histidine kinase [Granulicella aggregans]MBB5060525.1 signal transduction histidine kinase [Granulicella aggregans]